MCNKLNHITIATLSVFPFVCLFVCSPVRLSVCHSALISKTGQTIIIKIKIEGRFTQEIVFVIYF